MSTTITKMLPVKLTSEEFDAKAHELTVAMDSRKVLDSELQQVKDTFKSKIATADATVTSLHKIVRERAELRPVPCTEGKDYQRSRVDVVRLDTGEIVEWRPMTQGERQEQLFADKDRDQDIAELEASGMPKADAEKLVDGVEKAFDELAPRGRKAKKPAATAAPATE
jgi:HD-GYP domain-containing protein (c-di-GMP phosphodiesterase class II)